MFTKAENTFLRGPRLLTATEAESEEECATACKEEESGDCQFWAWCPEGEEDG